MRQRNNVATPNVSLLSTTAAAIGAGDWVRAKVALPSVQTSEW